MGELSGADMIGPEDKAKIQEMQVAAWRHVSAEISVIEQLTGKSRELAITTLIAVVNRDKRRISDAIDRAPDVGKGG